jgi:hypothetical protein
LAINAYAHPILPFFETLNFVSTAQLGNDFSAWLIPDIELVRIYVLFNGRGRFR